MAGNVGSVLTRKIGPLPAWSYAVIGVGGVLILRRFQAAKLPATDTTGPVSAAGIADGGATPGAAYDGNGAGYGGALGGPATDSSAVMDSLATINSSLAAINSKLSASAGGTPSAHQIHVNRTRGKSGPSAHQIHVNRSKRGAVPKAPPTARPSSGPKPPGVRGAA